MKRASQFPQLLKKERERLGLTQKALAAQMDTTQTTIARWESGLVTPLPVFEKAILTMLAVFPGHKVEGPVESVPESVPECRLAGVSRESRGTGMILKVDGKATGK